MIFFRVFRHLLPNARAWRLLTDKKLRALFEGLTSAGADARTFFDSVWLDIFPKTTREVSAWEQQFGLPDVRLSESDRRDRLAAAWQAVGGQDPRYIQDTLRARGFDVYVHEWWEPGTEPSVGVSGCATSRNPLQWIRREFTDTTILVECGEALAACGEDFAQAGNALTPRGYPLVNKITETIPDIEPLCGEALAACGEELAQCGNYFGFREIRRTYIVPNDPDKWPYFLYIGGETFGTIAQVSPSRRDEFENLCLKICPAQQWLGILVEYT
jgi:uncharacterized protein YmfQ (DUF2313 family)